MAIQIIQLPIQGMSCSSCARTLTKHVENMPGLVSQNVNDKTNSGEFTIDDSLVSAEDLIARINETHYKVDLPESATHLVPGKEKTPCPTCNQSTELVPNTVLRSNVIPEIYKTLDLEAEHNLCINPTCEAAYSSNGKVKVKANQMKRELYFKDSSTRKIICYCNNVDRDQVTTAVNKNGLTTWEDVMGHYRNKVQEKCEFLHPLGTCCRDEFAEFVEELKR
tara:strand:- start:3647 stop:4312 length:666 start_codon:yes stop_codon:yes gene_type:complete